MTKNKKGPGRPKKDKQDLRTYQRVALLESTYNRATYNAAKLDLPLLEYFDKIVTKESEYNE